MRQRPWTALPVIVLAGCAGASGARRAPMEAQSLAATPPGRAPAVPLPPPPAPPAPQTLYARIGGLEAIRAVVPQFLANVAADERIGWLFAMSDLERLQTRLVEFLCSALGGPCKYTGRDMRTAHARLPVGPRHFDAMVEDLGKALDRCAVPAREKGEIVAALERMRGDIVH